MLFVLSDGMKLHSVAAFGVRRGLLMKLFCLHDYWHLTAREDYIFSTLIYPEVPSERSTRRSPFVPLVISQLEFVLALSFALTSFSVLFLLTQESPELCTNCNKNE